MDSINLLGGNKMGRTKGSLNRPKQPETMALSEDEKLSLIADLLLELVMDELTKQTGQTPCKTL